MKPRLHCTTTFNLRLMGAMPVMALSLVLYPAIAKAEITSEKLLFPDSPSQVDKGVEDPDFSSSKRGEALNSPHVLGSSDKQLSPLELPSTSSAPVIDTSIPDIQPSETEI
ncbi:hypothetical protein, partial [Nostoc sp. CALU 546]